LELLLLRNLTGTQNNENMRKSSTNQHNSEYSDVKTSRLTALTDGLKYTIKI